MEISKLNRFIAISILLTNLHLIPLNIITLKDCGGPMGYGLTSLPLLLSTNLLIIPAVLTFKKKLKNSFILLFINGIGIVWNIFWLFLALTVPKMD